MTTPTTTFYKSRPDASSIAAASQSEATAINDFIYMSQGASNSYMILTAEGRVIVNTGMGFEARTHKRLFDAVDSGPIRYILLTQGHVDHVGGVDYFRESGTEVVAQRNLADQQAEDARLQPVRVSRSSFAFSHIIDAAVRFLQRPPEGDRKSLQDRPQATITFEDRYAFELGGLRFELISTPGGETLDSMCVWLPQHRILFSGNCLGPLFPHLPNLVTIRGDRYRDALRYVESVNRLLALAPDVLVTGHFEPVRGAELIRCELTRLRDATQYMHDETVAGMNAGKDVHTLMREIRLPPELAVGQNYGKLAWNVRTIWEYYMGWFHHQSTTELYHVPYRAVHPDLVELAGGPDPVAARAKEKLDGGAPLAAIHLTEVALAVDPTHRRALAVSRTAHERLLAECENFWERAWLTKQIGEIDAKLGPS